MYEIFATPYFNQQVVHENRNHNYFTNVPFCVSIFRDEFMSKKRVFEERRSQDFRKTAITENALNLCLQRKEKNEAFAELQAEVRIDDRFVILCVLYVLDSAFKYLYLFIRYFYSLVISHYFIRYYYSILY